MAAGKKNGFVGLTIDYIKNQNSIFAWPMCQFFLLLYFVV